MVGHLAEIRIDSAGFCTWLFKNSFEYENLNDCPKKKGLNKKCLIKITSLKLRVLEKRGEAINL
jgi:hypothetical protein